MFRSEKKQSFLPSLRRWLLILAGAAVFSLAARVLLPVIREKGVIVEGVSVGGIPLAGLRPEEAVAVLTNRLAPFLAQPVELQDGDFTFSFVPDQWGFFLEYDQLAAEAFALGRVGNIWQRRQERSVLRNQPLDITPEVKTGSEQYERLLHFLATRINKPPVEAELLVNRKGEVTAHPGRPGRSLNIRELETKFSRVILAQENRRLDLPVDPVEPGLSTEKIRKWDLTRLVSYYNTRFDPEDRDRVHNIRTAASSLHGALVLPGEKLSFNRRVGPRVTEQGYREAPVIYDNRLVPGVGGGVCQVSTALYNVWLLAGFPVDTRFNHSLPSAYVEMGRDAAVVDGGQDLVVVNPLPTPVYISTHVEGDTLTVAVLGKNNDGLVYTLEPRMVETISPPVLQVEDSSLAPGEIMVEEEGRYGYIVDLWRLARDREGETFQERVNRSIYQPVPRLLRTGVKQKPEGEEENAEK